MEVYKVNPKLFRARRFVNKGSHPKNKMKIVNIPLAKVSLEKGILILKSGIPLTAMELKLFNKEERSKYLIKIKQKANGSNKEK